MENTKFCVEWISAARNGDQEAIADLYNCAYQDVHIVIRSMIRADEDTVLDLLQDTFVKVFQRLEQLDDPQKYKAWVKQVARNTTLDYLKKSKAILFSELTDDDSIPIEIEDEDLSHLPDIVMDKQETARLVREILNSLPEVQRAVISMHYIQDIPVKEIAVILGRSENTVKVQLRNGRKSLEKKIRELEQKEDVKLYSLAPLPFLLLLLRNMAIPAQPDPAILGTILQSGTAAGSSAAGAATAGAAAKAAGGVAAKKAVAGILAAAVLAGGTAVYSAIFRQPDYPEKDLFVDDYRVSFSGKNGAGVANVHSLDGYGLDYSIDPGEDLSNGDVVTLTLSAPNGDDLGEYCEKNYGFTPTSDEKEYTVSDLDTTAEPLETAYDYTELVADYSAFVRGEISVEDVCVDLSRYAYICTPALSCLNGEGYFVVRNDVRYSLVEYDINEDGIKELITLEVSQNTEDEMAGTIIDIFTYRDGQPVWLIGGAERCEIVLCENGIIHERGSGGAEAIGNWFYEIVDGELVVNESAEMDWGTFYVNGSECSEELYWRTVDQYWPIMAPAFKHITTIEK